MKRAALATFALLLLLSPLVLHARTTTTFGQNAVGAACNNIEKATDFDAIAQCNAGTGAGTMQTAPLILGTITAPPYANTTCDAGKAGMLQWTGTSFQGCNGTAWSNLGDSIQGAGDVGEVVIWPAGTVPTGYLECNGSAVSRTTYAELFAVIGTMYGAGDGTTTFNLPDYRGEFLRGWANGSTNDPDRAARTNRGDGVIGDNVGTKQAGQTLSHLHVVDPPSTASNTVADHTHAVDPPSTASAADAAHTHAVDPPSTASADGNANHQHSIDPPATNSGNQSSNHVHSINPPSTTIPSSGAHTHTQAFPGYNPGSPTDGGLHEDRGPDTTKTIASSGAHTHTVDMAAFNSGGNTTSHVHATDIGAFNSGWMSANHAHSVDIASFTSGAGSSHAHAVDIASFSSGAGGGHSHTTDVASFDSTSVGGNETRPRNVSVIYIIRFQKEVVAAEHVGALTPQNFQVAGDATSAPVSFNATAPVTLTTTVSKIQGRAVASTAPTDGQTLVWNTASSTWLPGASSMSTLGISTASASPYRVGEVNTGLYSPAAGTVGVVSAGTEIMRVTASGVGIGTTSPHVPLHVAAHGASGIAYFTNRDFVNASTGSGVYFGTGASSGNTYSLLQAGINGGSNAGDLILNPYSGNVGIGTATPQALLHVNGSARIGSEAGGNLGVGAYSTSGSSIFTLGYEGGGAASAYVGYATAGASTLHVGYQTGANVAAVYVGNGASTGGTILELGAGSTGTHSSFIDITGDATYSDYGLRIARGSGPNGGSYLTSRGTGDLFLQTAEAGDIGFNTSGARRMTILATGEVGIANAAPAFKLDVLGDINATRGNGTGVFYFASNTLRYLYYNGTSYILPSASLVVNGTTYPSDRRLKTDIEPISKDSAMGVINKLEPKRFHWHPDSEQGKVNKNYDFGMIAQDVQKILPEVVLETDSTGPGSADGKKAEPKTLNEKLGKTLAIDYTRFVPWLLAGLQEVAKQLKELEARVNALLDFEPRIKKLEAENEKLKAVNDTLNARLKAIEDRLSKKP